MHSDIYLHIRCFQATSFYFTYELCSIFNKHVQGHFEVAENKRNILPNCTLVTMKF